jgi:hypothetical protein
VYVDAAVIWQTAEVERCVDVLFEGLEADGVVAELGVPAFHEIKIDSDLSADLRRTDP